MFLLTWPKGYPGVLNFCNIECRLSCVFKSQVAIYSRSAQFGQSENLDTADEVFMNVELSYDVKNSGVSILEKNVLS